MNYPDFRGRGKTKITARHIYKGTLYIELEQDSAVGLVATYAMDRKRKTIFLCFRDFPGISDSVILLGFECTINTQNLNKIVRAIFEKFEI